MGIGKKARVSPIKRRKLATKNSASLTGAKANTSGKGFARPTTLLSLKEQSQRITKKQTTGVHVAELSILTHELHQNIAQGSVPLLTIRILLL